MNNFTPRAQKVLILAAAEAKRLHHQHVEPEHLLLGIISLLQDRGEQYLPGTRIDLVFLKMVIEKEVGRGDPTIHLRNFPLFTTIKKGLCLG